MYYRDDVRVAVLSSCGKDSTYASWWAIMQGWDVRALITVHVTSDDSMMFQLQNTSLAGLGPFNRNIMVTSIIKGR